MGSVPMWMYLVVVWKELWRMIFWITEGGMLLSARAVAAVWRQV